MRFTTRPLLPFGLAVALIGGPTGCENAPRWGDDEPTASAPAQPDLGPTAAYDRHLLFLGPGPELLTAAVFDFASVSDSLGVHRGVRVRLLENADWLPLMDAAWELDPLREPWRLLPHGPLKVFVSDAGELSALTFQGDPKLRLLPGAILHESSPDAATQLVLRQARLDVEDAEVAGILLDAQLGHSVAPTPGPADGRYGEPPGDSDPDRDPRAADTAAADTLAAASPGARRGTEALLVDSAGYSAIFTRAAAGRIAWTSAAGQAELRRDVILEPTAWADWEGGDQVPTAWRVGAPGDDLTGELQSVAADHVSLAGAPGLDALGYVYVTGWIEDRSARHEVFGLLRHVQ